MATCINGDMMLSDNESKLHLPRILCLHGGGTNARIFQTQCRKLIFHLQNEFRFVFAQGPFPSQAGSDVLSVYSGLGPFRRWLRWRPEHPRVPATDVIREIDRSLEEAMSLDDSSGATGEWVCLLGFSQGAKVSASLLYRQQVGEALPKVPGASKTSNFRFGVLFAGRAPLVSLGPSLISNSALPDASEVSDSMGDTFILGDHVLRIPTLHVHGTRDPNLNLHRILYDKYCGRDVRRLVEWDGNHRIPLKKHEIWPIVQHIRELAKETGVR